MLTLAFLSLIVFIAVIASLTQLVEMVVEKYAPALYASLGIFLPLIAVNCAILGGSLFMQQRDFRVSGRQCAPAAGWGIGWLLAITAVAAVRERVAPVLQGACTASGRRHYFYNNRSDGYRLL